MRSQSVRHDLMTEQQQLRSTVHIQILSFLSTSFLAIRLAKKFVQGCVFVFVFFFLHKLHERFGQLSVPPQDPNQDHPLELVLLPLQSPLVDQLLDISCSPTPLMSLTSAGFMFF